MAACPICSKPATREHSPFCSKGCRTRDLHRWLTGRYAVPTEEMPDTPTAAQNEEHE